jgi:CheY-like chemotaxis protein
MSSRRSRRDGHAHPIYGDHTICPWGTGGHLTQSTSHLSITSLLCPQPLELGAVLAVGRVVQTSLLLVDNDPDSEEIADRLREHSFNVRVVHDGHEAQLLLRTFRPNTVVLNLVLPGMSGLVLTRALKSDPVTCHAKIIATCRLDSPEVRQLAAHAGCAVCVGKRGDLESFVSELLPHLGIRP